MFTQKITESATISVPQAPVDVTNQGIILLVDSTDGAVVITLPPISSFPAVPQFKINVIDVGGVANTNNITVTPDGEDSVNGEASILLRQNNGFLQLEIVGSNSWSGTGSVDGLPVVAVTATADGTGTGTIIKSGVFANVTSGNATHIVVLPPPIPGTVVKLLNGATGYELRSSAPATISINGGSGASAQSAIAASTYVEMRCVSATAWIGSQFATDGTQTAVEAAA